MNKNILEEPLQAHTELETSPSQTMNVSVPTTNRLPGKGKKVWIDIDNSPHVPFFIPIIDELKKQGFEVVLTARDMYQVCELLEFFKLRSSVKVIGGHAGKNKALKVLVNCVRTLQLMPFATRNRPDLALSHGSRAQVLASKVVGIPSIMMHDYEHSTKTGFLESDWTLMPDVIPDSAMSRKKGRTLKYPGLKEDVYIPRFTPDATILSSLGIRQDELLITLRPPATEAHYHNPESETLFAATLELIGSKTNLRAVTLPRNSKQAHQLRKDWANLIKSGHMVIPEHPVDGLNLIWFSDLVISGGGTMNREAAALNVPVYSIFRGKIGAVDRYLSETGRLILLESVDDVRNKIELKRREKPLQVESCRPEALNSIIQAIITIGETHCQTTQGRRN